MIGLRTWYVDDENRIQRYPWWMSLEESFKLDKNYYRFWTDCFKERGMTEIKKFELGVLYFDTEEELTQFLLKYS